MMEYWKNGKKTSYKRNQYIVIPKFEIPKQVRNDMLFLVLLKSFHISFDSFVLAAFNPNIPSFDYSNIPIFPEKDAD